MKRFADKTVIITGGATGIGFAAAQLFTQEGAQVVIAGRNVANGEAAIQRLEELGGTPLFVQTDVSREEDVKDLLERTIAFTGHVDVLINNAAAFYESDFLEETTERWREIFNVIIEGSYLCKKYAAKAMITQGNGGAIVNVSSINGYRALAKSSHYNAAKGASDQLTRYTALELAPHGIRVNGVAPGFVDTGLSVIGGVNELETEEFQKYYVEQRKIPLTRAGRPEEIATIITFLASADSSYMQGAIIPTDGGLSITF